jgi:propanediol dehydratase large subunit
MDDAARIESSPSKLGRFRVLDARPVNLDGFCVEAPDMGLVAFASPHDPEPSLQLDDEGNVVEMDGVSAEQFDSIDVYIARHGIDTAVALDAMALDDARFARMMVDPAVPRAEVSRLAVGMTPAKLARVIQQLRAVELQMAITKMRVRSTPSIQAHVTNRLDDPMLLAADAATAVAYGFRELETTVPVLGDAPSNALAMLIGSQVFSAGALVQCSIEEALELELGMRGLTTYAETVSLYGTEQVFVDGDDTPWSKAFLTSAYASRGLKMRVTSGGGAEVLMGAAEGKSTFYLEARCVALARAIGAQGVQNGGIDGACVVSSVPEGMRALLGENLLVMLLDLESCSGNDLLISESDIRRTSHLLPLFLAGSDFICSGYGSVARHDNMFQPSCFNADDLDDYLVMQRDWGVDGGLRSVDEETIRRVRERAARAIVEVYRDLGLADLEPERVADVVRAYSSKDLTEADDYVPLSAATAILEKGITALDVIRSLARTGFEAEAERVLGMIRARIVGDYLQTAAIFDEDMGVLSRITDPNEYAGPGTGYLPSERRRSEIATIRQEKSIDDLLAEQAALSGDFVLSHKAESEPGHDPREVCIGLSPAFATELWVTLSGIPVSQVLREISAGLEEEGCLSRLVLVRSTVDLGMIGLTAAQLSGSGIGIGLQAKGTVLIHRRDLPPLANLELLSVAPYITREMYRQIGINAGRHAKGQRPVPNRNPYFDESCEARYQSKVCALIAIERAAIVQAVPVDVEAISTRRTTSQME